MLKNALNRIFNFFVEAEPDAEAIKNESSFEYRSKLNKGIQIEENQLWRFPVEREDRYSAPVFLEIKEIFENEVKVSNSYSKKEYLVPITDIKQKMIFVS